MVTGRERWLWNRTSDRGKWCIKIKPAWREAARRLVVYQLLTTDTSHVVQTGVSSWHQLLYPTTADDAIRLMLSALDWLDHSLDNSYSCLTCVFHFHFPLFKVWSTGRRLLQLSCKWLGSRVVSVLDSGAEGTGVLIAVATLSGNNLRQAVHTYWASVYQAARLVAALLGVTEVTAGLAESTGSLPLGLWLTSLAGWLPRTEISPGTGNRALATFTFWL